MLYFHMGYCECSKSNTIKSMNIISILEYKSMKLEITRKKTFGEIENLQLASLVEEMMRWTFTTEHVSGPSNYGPEGLSHYLGREDNEGALSSPALEDQKWSNNLEAGVIASVIGGTGVKVVTVLVVREAGMIDREYSHLLEEVGTVLAIWEWSLAGFKRYKDKLFVADIVVLYEGQIVVPRSLQDDLLGVSHQAHQGSRSMSLRVASMVWWQGIAADIAWTHEMCQTCVKNAPSQQSMPSTKLLQPDY